MSDNSDEKDLCSSINSIDSKILPNNILSSPVKSWDKCIGKESYLSCTNTYKNECTDDDSTFYDCPSPGRFKEDKDTESTIESNIEGKEEETGGDDELIKFFLGNEDDNESYQTCESDNSQITELEKLNAWNNPFFDDTNPWNTYLTTLGESKEIGDLHRGKSQTDTIEMDGDKVINDKISTPDQSSSSLADQYSIDMSLMVESVNLEVQTSEDKPTRKNSLPKMSYTDDNIPSSNQKLEKKHPSFTDDNDFADEKSKDCLDISQQNSNKEIDNQLIARDSNCSEPISQDYVDKLAKLVHIYREEHKAARFLVGTLKLEKQDLQLKLNEVIDKFLQRQNHFYLASSENTKLKATQRDLQKAINTMRGQLTNEFASAVKKNKKIKKELHDEKRHTKKLEAEIERLKSKKSM